LRASELKGVVMKKAFSDDGDMTRFNRVYGLAKEWEKLSRAEAGSDVKSERYGQLKDAGTGLEYFLDYVEGRTKMLADYAKKGVAAPSEDAALEDMRRRAYAMMDEIEGALGR
jgi:hypothetical protein